MERDALGQLSHAELLEMIRRQQEALAERDAAIERRDEKIRELEEEFAQFRRPVKTPENSSVPPSRGQKANRVERRGRKPDRRRGHVGVSRQ
jgi:transposase